MTQKNTRRGFTQIVANKNCHFQSGRPQDLAISHIRFGKRTGEFKEGLSIGHSSLGKELAEGGTKRLLRGFTLIELLVVVLIIGILAAVAVPQYKKAVLRSKFAGTLVSLNAIYKGQILYQLENGTYATSLDQLNLQVDGSVYSYSENPNANADCLAIGGTTKKGIYVSCTLYVPKRRQLNNNIVNVNIDVTNGKKRCYSKKATNYIGNFLCESWIPNVTGEYLWNSDANWGYVEPGFGL